MLEHSFKNEFLTAAKKKYRDLEHWNIFSHVNCSTASFKILSLKWVFIYKLDENNYLIKFKARICVRGDLQNSDELDTYAAMCQITPFSDSPIICDIIKNNEAELLRWLY